MIDIKNPDFDPLQIKAQFEEWAKKNRTVFNKGNNGQDYAYTDISWISIAFWLVEEHGFVHLEDELAQDLYALWYGEINA